MNNHLIALKFDPTYGLLEDEEEEDDDESGWETVSHMEDQGSNYSPNRSDPSVTKWEENDETTITEITEVVPPSKSAKKPSSISRLWRSSYSSNGGGDNNICKMVPFDGRLSNGTHLSSGAVLSPDRSSGVSLSEWSSPGSGGNKPHVTKGGCIEWPRGVMQKNSLKAKLLEARMESQKVQLRQVLKQKI